MALIKKFMVTAAAVLMVIVLGVFSACSSSASTEDGSKAVTISGLEDFSIEAGETYRFLGAAASDGDELNWVSSNEKVVTVENLNGMIVLTAVSFGVAEVTAYCNHAQSTCAVTVTTDGSSSKDVSVTVSESFVYVDYQGTASLTASSSDGGDVYWFSSLESVARVNGGVISGVSVGTTTIIACSAWAQTEVTVAVNSVGTVEADSLKTLVWSDEFEGDSLDTEKWGYQTGINDVYHGKASSTLRWGNNEQQYYTEDAVSVSGGCLEIKATREQKEDCAYTSGRILTRDLYYVTYGYIEARIKMPAITGLWPAFWMLPQPSDYSSTTNIYGGWSQSGEIDIMEAKGRLPYEMCGTLHYGRTQYTGSDYYMTDNLSIANWHTYAVDWREDHITWYVDGVEFFTMKSSEWYTDASDNDAAPFDQPFYILLNLAVGGNFDNSNVPPEGFESASMYVDYVRVYA